MQLNTEKTEEVIFSTKKKAYPPNLNAGMWWNGEKTEQTLLGVILDDKCNFQSHQKEAILKARSGIGGNGIVYHKCDPEMKLVGTKRFEQTQHSAALAVTVTWKGASR